MGAATVHDLAVGRRSARTPLLDALRAAAAHDWTDLGVPDLAEGLELLREVHGRLEQLLVRRAEEFAREAQRDEEDEELDTEGLMRLLRRSRSWVEHQGKRVPGHHQPGGHGTRPTWSKRQALAWARSRGR